MSAVAGHPGQHSSYNNNTSWCSSRLQLQQSCSGVMQVDSGTVLFSQGMKQLCR
jgi:hypothetical protein